MLTHLSISISHQQLLGYTGKECALCLPVSTALNGAGELNGSNCTPRGLHYIRAKIGDGLVEGSVLRARRWTGEVWTPELAARSSNKDWVLSRILWLSGCELGVNRLGSVDTFRRYIYLHGTPDTEPMGVPLSHGCIRLRNHDITTLFDQISVGCSVIIE